MPKQISGGFGRMDYWSLSDEGRTRAREQWAEGQKKPINRILHAAYYWRGRLSDFLAPDGWRDE